MCPTSMTLALGGACPPPRPHLALIPHGARVAWGHGGGCTPPRASVMPVGHMDALYCAITALDGYPSHLDNIHYIRSATLIYALPPSTDHAITSILDTPYICLLLLADICLFPSRAT